MSRKTLLATLLFLLPMGIAQQDCEDTCTSDADQDGVCDDVDQCPEGDDTLDTDLDGIPDACDACPTDSTNDADGDGQCDGSADITLSSLPTDLAVLQRNEADVCEITIQGSSNEAESLNLQVTQDDGLYSEQSAVPTDGTFSFEVSLAAGLHNYDLSLVASEGGTNYIAADIDDIACGDIIFLQGQSNANAADYHGEALGNQHQSPWIRSWGSGINNATVVEDVSWGLADGEIYLGHGQVGQWGLRMAKQILDNQQMPLGLLNGAVGGTTLAQHQRNDDNPEDLDTIYGRMLWRAQQSGMFDDAKYIIWYQGESDGLGDPAVYEAGFADLTSDWYEDFPSLEHIYMFQVRPGCGIDLPMDAYIGLQFFDSNTALVKETYRQIFTFADWHNFSVSDEAPAGAEFVNVVLVGAGIFGVYMDEASLLNNEGIELLSNASFETGLRFPDNWNEVGQGSITWVNDSAGASEGSHYMLVDASSGAVYMQQSVLVNPGDTYQFSTNARYVGWAGYTDVRETLRGIAQDREDITLMSTNGTSGHDSCHFYYQGYEQLGRRMADLIERDYYAAPAEEGIMPANPTGAYWIDSTNILLEMGEGSGALTVQAGAHERFYIEDAQVIAAQPTGNDLILTLSQPTTYSTLGFLGHTGDGAFVVGPRGVGMVDFMNLDIQSQ